MRGVPAPPPSFLGRRQEWAALDAFASDEGPGTRLAVVRGRRRLGKSTLLQALVEAHGGFYHQALEGTTADQLRDLSAAVGARLGLAGALDLRGWEEALEVLLGSAALPRLVVLDEFSFLVTADPTLPSRLQRRVDATRADPRATRLVLCGSALSVMSGLLVGAAPLRGRASVEVPLRPLHHTEAAELAGVTDARAALALWSVVGGVPGYTVDLLARDVPAASDDVGAWMVRAPLSTGRPLLYEARHLLDEPAVRDRSLYLSALAAVADGVGTNAAVAGRLARPSATAAQTLALLADLELVERREDLLRPRRPTWSVADPLLRFWAVVLRRDWPRLERGRAQAVWADAEPRWRSQVLGPAVEDVVRRWVAATSRLGPVGRVGRLVVADAGARTTHEVDVVALDPTVDGARVAVLGEAKAGCAGEGQVARLRRVRDLLAARGLADDATRLLLVGAAGVDRDAGGPGVVLLDADDLYASD